MTNQKILSTQKRAAFAFGEKELKQMRTGIFNHMLQTRGWKYKAFLRYLRLFKYAAFAPIRGKFLESYYVLMRYLDDVVDGDVSLPDGYLSAVEYMEEKIRFSQYPKDPGDNVESLMIFCFKLADRFGENFQSETKDILSSLLFDARRKDKLKVFPERDLVAHFHELDIRGTIRATLKVFKEDPEKYTLLEPLGTACRYQYDIEDIDTDLEAGYVNISREECEELNISPQDLMDASSLPIKRWLIKHAREGLALLEEHHRIMPTGKFSLIARTTFPLVYENPARKVFEETLKKFEHIE